MVDQTRGTTLKFRVHLELRSGDSKSSDTLANINKALEDVAPDFQMD